MILAPLCDGMVDGIKHNIDTYSLNSLDILSGIYATYVLVFNKKNNFT